MNAQIAELVRRLLNLPDRIMELAMGEALEYLEAAHAVLDRGEKPPADENAWARWVRGSDRNYRVLYDALMAMVIEWAERHGGTFPKCALAAHVLRALPQSIPRHYEPSALPKAPLPDSCNYVPIS